METTARAAIRAWAYVWWTCVDIFLVDVKANGEANYRALAKLLAEYDDIVSLFGDKSRDEKAVKVVVSGDRALPAFRVGATIRGASFTEERNMNDETEPERRRIYVFDIDLETGEVPVRELHIVHEAASKPGRTSLAGIDLSRVLGRLNERG